MTFTEIERVLGAKLPPNSPQYPAWWSNNPTNNVMTKVWLDAGFRTEQVDVKARKVVFRRVRGADAAKPSSRAARSAGFGRKNERHPLFGAMKGLVIIPPGVDLTEPADPEWGNIWDEKS